MYRCNCCGSFESEKESCGACMYKNEPSTYNIYGKEQRTCETCKRGKFYLAPDEACPDCKHGYRYRKCERCGIKEFMQPNTKCYTCRMTLKYDSEHTHIKVERY